MDEGASDLRWGVERRMEFIEFRLYWEGGINRSDIVGQFGVSVPQASYDLSRYQELAPGNMSYDKSAKRYLSDPRFVPRFLRPDPDEYLSQLNAVAMSTGPLGQFWPSRIPSIDSLPVLHRRVDSGLLRAFLHAVRNELALEILYQSMNPARPEPVWRGISPHSIANDGNRWHIRALCHIDNTFKDFLFSRCLDFRPAGHALRKPSDDKNWAEILEVELIPNPKLSKSQQFVISRDYGFENGKLTISIRSALYFYLKRQLRLGLAELLDNPREAPVVIASRTSTTSADSSVSKT